MNKCSICSSYDYGKYDYRDADILEHLYSEHDLSQREIAELLECSRTTIKTWFDKNNVETTSRKYDIPEKDLREKYLKEENTLEEVASEFDCSYCVIRNRLEEYDIDIRNRQQSSHLEEDAEYKDAERLRELYHQEEKSIERIAECFDVSFGTVQYYMEKYGIETRELSESHSLYYENEKEYRDKGKLKEMYVEDNKTTREIAKEFDVSQSAIAFAIDKYGFEKKYAGRDGKAYQANDGSYYRSAGERTIANWFVKEGVDFDYEPNIQEKLVPDFKVDGIIIEYWGMVANEEYRERMAEKIEFYEEENIQRIDLYPSDLNRLGEKLGLCSPSI